MGRIDGFERKVVLRLSRALYLLLALGASASLCGGIATFGWGMTPTLEPSDPPPIPPPPTPTIALAEVTAALGQAEEGSGDAPVAVAEGSGDSAHDAQFTALARQAGALFDTSRFPWLSKTENHCDIPGWGDCYHWVTRTTAKGVVEMLDDALGGEEPDVQIALLGAVVDLASAVGTADPAPARDAIRFTSVKATLDLFAANGKVEPVAHEGLRSAMSDDAHRPRPTSEVQPLLDAVLLAKKKGADPGTQSAWFQAAPGFLRLFPPPAPDATAAVDPRVDGLVATWEAVRDASAESVPGRLSALSTLAQAAPASGRAASIRTWGRLVREKTAKDQADYEAAVAKRDAAIAEQKEAVEARKIQKAALVVSATGVVGTALSVLAVLGLFLALLGVERNTRSLQDVLQQMSARGA
jgi:hypothetical protein